MDKSSENSPQQSPDTTCISPEVTAKAGAVATHQSSPDMVTCGDCFTSFPLDNILDFIAHKRIHALQQQIEAHKRAEENSVIENSEKNEKVGMDRGPARPVLAVIAEDDDGNIPPLNTPKSKSESSVLKKRNLKRDKEFSPALVGKKRKRCLMEN